MSVQIKRAYDAPSLEDGHRVLVDRLWPRGLSKEQARVDAWVRDIAPSGELRRWFGHDPDRWPEFRERYREALGAEPQQRVLRELARRAAAGTVTLVYGARDDRHNNAVVLAEVLAEMGD